MVYALLRHYNIILLRLGEITLQALLMSLIFNDYVTHLPKVIFKMHSMI